MVCATYPPERAGFLKLPVAFWRTLSEDLVVERDSNPVRSLPSLDDTETLTSLLAVWTSPPAPPAEYALPRGTKPGAAPCRTPPRSPTSAASSFSARTLPASVREYLKQRQQATHVQTQQWRWAGERQDKQTLGENSFWAPVLEIFKFWSSVWHAFNNNNNKDRKRERVREKIDLLSWVAFFPQQPLADQGRGWRPCCVVRAGVWLQTPTKAQAHLSNHNRSLGARFVLSPTNFMDCSAHQRALTEMGPPFLSVRCLLRVIAYSSAYDAERLPGVFELVHGTASWTNFSRSQPLHDFLSKQVMQVDATKSATKKTLNMTNKRKKQTAQTFLNSPLWRIWSPSAALLVAGPPSSWNQQSLVTATNTNRTWVNLFWQPGNKPRPYSSRKCENNLHFLEHRTSQWHAQWTPYKYGCLPWQHIQSQLLVGIGGQ